MTAILLFAMMAPMQSIPAVTEDSVEQVRRTARSAERNFERLARRLAPIKLGGSDGRSCDEIVGRFCLTYDSGRLPEPEPKPGPVIDARRDAIEALRHAFSYMPGDFETAAPLIRYLVEDGRAAEAVPAARMFALVSGDTVWGPLLLGFALHAAANDTAAAREFESGLGRIEKREADRIRDVEWLLGTRDRGRYDDLVERGRVAFEEQLWAMADPLYLTAGNERRNEHIARHVWSRILARTPFVSDMVRWGSDLEQLTVRYGISAARTRSPAWGLHEGSLTEHYDPDQLAYVPESLLTRGHPPTPLPDDPWELGETRSRSGYAPVTVSRLRFLPHQVSRFPTASGAILRVDGMFRPDSQVPGAPTRTTIQIPVHTGLFVLRDGIDPVGEKRERRIRTADTLPFWFEIELPMGEMLYSLEAIEDSTLRAGRARYIVTIDSSSVLRVSDPVILAPTRGAAAPATRQDPSFQPTADLRFEPYDTIGIYAEISGLGGPGASFEVQVSVEKASRASLPARVANWLGDRLGLTSPSGPPRLRWTAVGNPAGEGRIAVDLALDGLDDGAHVILLQVTDPASATTTASRRVIVVKS